MRITDVFTSKNLASVHTQAGSNLVPYFFEGLFPRDKKMSLDLKSIRTHSGLTVALKPSQFDAKSTIRSREGFKKLETEMAYFKESMIVKEQDEQDIMRMQDSADPFAQEVINRIYDDANILIDSANVIPEIMRSQLMANENGKPSISLVADGATYAYDYDPDNEYSTNNYLALSGTSLWTDTTNSDPLSDVETAKTDMLNKYGVLVDSMVINTNTMNLLKANAKLKGYILAQNTTANVYMSAKTVKDLFFNELGVTIYVYDKQYKDYAGNAKKFYPNGMATLFPSNVALGKTWYGCTPDERTGIQNKAKDVTIVDTGVAVAVIQSDDPNHTKTTVSEVVLPSFENIMSTYMIKCGTVSYT